MSKKYKTLVVDDEQIICDFVATILDRMGHDVTTKSDDREGLDVASTEPYDAVVCDLQMLEVDGLQIAEAARRRNAEVAVVLMSGHCSAEVALRAFSGGADGFVSKPFSIDEFTREMRRVLAKRALSREAQETAEALTSLRTGVESALREFHSRTRMPDAGAPSADVIFRHRSMQAFLEQCLRTVGHCTGISNAVLLIPDAELKVLHPAALLGENALEVLLAERTLDPPGKMGLNAWMARETDSPRKGALPLAVEGKLCAVLRFRGDPGKLDRPLIESLSRLTSAAVECARLQNDWIESAQGIIEDFEAHDPYLNGHSARVAHLATRLASGLGIQGHGTVSARLGGVLHDFGRIGLMDHVANKKGVLSDPELEHVRGHAKAGAEAMGRLGFLDDVIPVVRNHHERWDGQGYPDRLAGKGIPAPSRISALCDALDAMVSPRPHRHPLSKDRVWEEISENRGVQFDPEFTTALMDILGDAGK